MAIEDVDFVSDLNGTGDTTVSVHEGESTHGDDALELNNQRPREPAATAKKLPAEPEPADKPLSLRDQISSALKGEGEDTPPAASQDGIPRNPDGTFAPKAAADALTDPATLATPPVAAPIAPPQGISPEVFKSLPAETQAELARTMDGIAQSQQRFGRLEQVEQLISPRRDAWALNGMTEAQALNQLFALSDFAGRDMPGFIQYMAEQSGIDLEQLVVEAEPVDPAYKQLQDEVAELRNAREQDEYQKQQAAHNATVDSVVTFATEKDQAGNLLRPHFDDLGNDVLPFISAVKAQNPNWPHNQVLQEAYDRACWGSPTVRAKMQAAAEAAGEAERLRQGQDKVTRARTASASVRSGTPTGEATPPNDASRSLRDTIRASIAATS